LGVSAQNKAQKILRCSTPKANVDAKGASANLILIYDCLPNFTMNGETFKYTHNNCVCFHVCVCMYVCICNVCTSN